MEINSPLVDYVKLSPNNSGFRTMPIDRITPHCTAGKCSVEYLGDLFAQPAYRASSNYAIGKDGRVGLYVNENLRSWCSSSYANDQRAVTIECSSDSYDPYQMDDIVWDKLIVLCADICKRNGKKKLLWLGDKETTLNYTPKEDEMVLTVHRWFANKACPGEWLYGRLGLLAEKVTGELNPKQTAGNDLYRVQVGAFRIKENAEKFLEKVKKAGFKNAFISIQKDYFK